MNIQFLQEVTATIPIQEAKIDDIALLDTTTEHGLALAFTDRVSQLREDVEAPLVK